MVRDRKELEQLLGYLQGFPQAQCAAIDAFEEQQAERDAEAAERDRRYGPKRLEGTITEDRERAATQVAVRLLRAVSLDPALARGLLFAWNKAHCNPPLQEEDLRSIFNRVARLQLAREQPHGR